MGDGAREVIDSFNPVSIANNIKKLIADPPDVKTFFKSIVTSFTHADDFKAAYDAWKSGDQYAFGKAVGKLVVELSADLVGLILGGTKAVTGITRALKGATASKKLDVGGGAGASCALRSFSGDTRVVMADGSLKRIDRVHIGDYVKTRNPVTGKTSAHPVIATWVHSDNLVAATFTAVRQEDEVAGRHSQANGDDPASHRLGVATTRIATTEDHPFWNATDARYEELRDFEPGDRLSVTRGETAVFTGLSSGDSSVGVAFNLTVSGPHTYLVAEMHALVHNCGDGDDTVDYSRPSNYRAGVREKVWTNAVEASTNQVRDPVTGRFMSKDQPWDMGHVPGHEFRRHAADAADRGISRKQFLDEHNNVANYRPELPSSNRGHKGEMLD